MRGNGSTQQPIRPQTRYNAATAPPASGANLRHRVRPIQPSKLLLWSHMAMVPEKGLKRKTDPSRALGTGGDGTPAADPDDLAGPRDSADTGRWRADAAGVGRRCGIRDCNTAAHGHSVRRSRTRRNSHRGGKSAAAEPLRREPPCPSQTRAGQRRSDHVSLEPD